MTSGRKWFLFLSLLILLIGGVGSWVLVQMADRHLRQDLLQESQMLSRDLNLDYLQSLHGDQRDLSSPKYQRLKEQLSLLKKAIPQCRFLYLMGKNAEGKVFVFLDSEPVGSKDYSPPGEIYSEVSTEFANVFETKGPIVEGPIRDRWGNWVSAVTPVVDPANGKVMAVLGMDLDARTWKSQLLKASFPVLLLSLVLFGILVLGTSLLSRRNRLQSAGSGGGLTFWIEPGMVLSAGVALTLFLAWMAHQGEMRQRWQAFVSLAHSKTTGVADSLRSLRDVGLEGVGSFCTGKKVLTQSGFEKYVAYLTRDSKIQTWAWLPKVPDSMRAQFEQQARESGWRDYRIWEKNQAGENVAAPSRESYFPVLYMAPREGNEPALGFDLASESSRRAALEEALRTGLASASTPVTFVQETNRQKGMLIFLPVYQADAPDQIRGLVAAGLRLGTLLRSAERDDYVTLQLSLLQGEGAPLSLPAYRPSSTWWGEPPSMGAPLSIQHPILAFGRVFIVTAIASAEYLDQYRFLWGVQTLVFGLLLSGALAWGVALTLRRGLQLERLVQGKTSELKEKNRHLDEIAALMGSLLDSIPDMIFFKDKEGIYLGCNPAFEQFVGRSRGEVVGKSDYDLFAREIADAFRENDQAMLQLQEPRQNEEWVTYPDGRRRLLDTVKTPYWGPERNLIGVLGISRDITERKEMEEKFLRAQRMESIGALAGGVAHDLNNILAPILMSSSMLRDESLDAQFREAMISGIETAAKRGANIVSQVLTFARGVHGVREAIAPASLLLEIENILGEAFPKSIGLSLDYPQELWSILGDFTQLHQVLMNLCVNARDAMPQGGILVLRAENFLADAAFASKFDGFKPGKYVRFRVTDTGMGIAPGDVEKIFEPFFTTKGPTAGTGLGLSTVLGIVRSHGGIITVSSQLGCGTTFEVLIPACDEVLPVAQSREEAGPLQGKGEMILLVDDEDEILRLLSKFLERNGYQVICAGDGEQALLHYSRHGEKIRLVITDLMMPHMNGAAFSSVLRKTNPGLPIIVASGFGTDAMQQEMAELEIQAFLHKPFDTGLLLRTIREVIHRP